MDDIPTLIHTYIPPHRHRQSTGETSLMLASIKGYRDVVQALVTAGANLEKKSDDGGQVGAGLSLSWGSMGGD